jgi:hypothetical protein
VIHKTKKGATIVAPLMPSPEENYYRRRTVSVSPIMPVSMRIPVSGIGASAGAAVSAGVSSLAVHAAATSSTAATIARRFMSELSLSKERKEMGSVHAVAVPGLGGARI